MLKRILTCWLMGLCLWVTHAQTVPSYLPDYSFCGYRHSDVPLPEVKNQVFVSWKEGDQSSRIQQAIDYVSSLPMDANGHRGAVLLDKGVFELTTSLRITTSGVVLRGMDKEQTCLLKKGVDRGAIIYMEGINDRMPLDTLAISSLDVAMNECTFQVAESATWKEGDRILIHRPSTKEWIASLHCNVHGGGHDFWGWKPGDADIFWDRTITQVQGNHITIDAPLTMALDAQWGTSTVIPYIWKGRMAESGIENLTLVSDYNPNNPKDEDHPWTGISIEHAENCWVRRVNFRHLAGSAVIVQPTGSQITVEDCISHEPISEIGGMRRYTFYTFGQHTLFQRCLSIHGIHDFSAGTNAAGPNAFVQCDAIESYGYSGATGLWSCGLLFDIVNVDGNDLRLMNVGPQFNGAGWISANSTLWQCSAASIHCFSPSSKEKNYVFGSWGQCWGNAEWHDMDSHIKPRSLFYAQWKQRNGKECDWAYILPLSTKASSSPTVEVAQQLSDASYQPLLTLDAWINREPSTIPVDIDPLKNIDQLHQVKAKEKVRKPSRSWKVSRQLLADYGASNHSILTVPWWNGKLRKPALSKALPHLTRFVPNREGQGLTDRIDDVLTYMVEHNYQALEHNYALWYDRRRDDHERIRRSNGEVWAPFYEFPFARSGEGKAWDGLSKYDLTRPNEWYWNRLREFADKAENHSFFLFHHHYFQHHLLEAGAHWVDFPWRTVNNINHTDFPEPVPFAGDKRIFMDEQFYDITHPVRRELHRNYIRMCLDQLAGYSSVVHFLSAEYTGPLHFVQFWLDVIAEWEKETGQQVWVALSTTKDVQDAILSDPVRSKTVDIIDIRYWYYHTTGLYAPKGGQHLSPRQHARQLQGGEVTEAEVRKAMDEYRTKYPDKWVWYHSKVPVTASK